MYKSLKDIYKEQIKEISELSGIENLPDIPEDIRDKESDSVGEVGDDPHFLHLIFDFQFLYYKYKFALDSGRMRRLSTPVEVGGVVVEKDVSQIYYALREIEGIRKKLEKNGKHVVVSVCFDSKSKRKDGDSEEAKEYKANRAKKLSDEDFNNIELVRNILIDAGYNVYKIDGIEADDLVHSLMVYSDVFDYTIIVTCDLDIAVNISDRVGLYRFKSSSGYGAVDMKTFGAVVNNELKCDVPFNAIMLYKATVGDKSDNIAGIKKFGPAAFTKLVNHINDTMNVDWTEMVDYEKVKELLQKCKGYLSDDQLSQALESLELVKPIELSEDEVEPPVKLSSHKLREQAYMKYNMPSLV